MRRLISMLIVLVPVLLEATAARAETSTHDWLFPTGDVVPRGEVHVRGHALYAYDTLAYGVNDRLELSFSAPVVPMFVHAHARVALTDRSSPFKLVLGAGALQFLAPETEAMTFWVLSGTAAYKWDGGGVHATISATKNREEFEGMGVINVGAHVKIGRNVSLLGEWARISFVDTDDFSVEQPLLVGLKFHGRTDVDVGFVMFPEHGFIFPLPMLTVTHRL